MILLDTHVLVWLDQGDGQLGNRARKTIEDAYRLEELAIATISFWEIGRLVQQGRLAFEGDLSDWRVTLINSGFQEFPADGVTSLTAAGLENFQGDAADRLIGAAAMEHEARLVTADSRFLGDRRFKTIHANR